MGSGGLDWGDSHCLRILSDIGDDARSFIISNVGECSGIAGSGVDDGRWDISRILCFIISDIGECSRISDSGVEDGRWDISRRILFFLDWRWEGRRERGSLIELGK
jgi:hypothetical protein